MIDIYEFLNTHGITFERYDHEAVYTCEQADCLDIPGSAAKTKNLFLRDRKGKRHFLVTVGSEKSVDIKALEDLLGAKGLSFASADRLERYLGLAPGSVTLLGVVNDAGGDVEVIVDEDLWQCDSLQCHPLVNTSTLIMTTDGVRRFLALTGHEPTIIRIPVRR
ncbi:MAG: Prolyl-tRNA editing protein ProX [Deltaproteobacteria bacterium ADurb.BinA179]|jgi:Ala-tRNA(Pro) deacylase|nr:prolyl-tRNA synthetase associated domain-containing protein [Deltaproteobacteria bacterium]MDI9542608.1 prolyl-tRNA synthetase associated domain-containing protein [Pseudomonadota bacterium]NLW68006.1 prolyl-tRNA synthetase associated domain-containing protein [Bacteriovoracaceae bacterium]OPZ30086.1 MAG: Prolyl-tRNA editing protein ProX [Deltaproteobacteria bacterium ADurb.BinA179]HRR20032.1 prolyl-tRNA synthetase associated domain-containing protein [Desulfomonilia bacterium]